MSNKFKNNTYITDELIKLAILLTLLLIFKNMYTVIYQSQLFFSLHCDTTLLCMCYIFMLFTCAQYDGDTI